MINNRPNIFEFATKELSQDAMVYWLLKCLDSQDSAYRQIGLDFIRLILDGTGIPVDTIKLDPCTPTKECHMDVYAVIYTQNKLYPIIFEDKTNTYLHNEQIERYSTTVAEWMRPHRRKKDDYLHTISERMGLSGDVQWGEIVFVYYKTGYPFGWQQNDLLKQQASAEKKVKEMGCNVVFKNIYLEDMVGFLRKHNNDPLLLDYCSALETKLCRRRFAEENCLVSAESCQQALSNEIGSNETAIGSLFAECFGKDTWFSYSHQCWATMDLVATQNEWYDDKQPNRIYYGFRFEQCSYGNKKSAYAFQFYQYRNEGAIKESKAVQLQKKIVEANQILELCKRIIVEVAQKGIEVVYLKPHEQLAKSFNDQKLFKVFVAGDNNPKQVCAFIRAFSERFCQHATEIGGEVCNDVFG